MSPTSPLLHAFLISTLDARCWSSALWQEPFVLAPRCRLFILENCSSFKYPHSIVPLGCVLALFYVFFLSYEGFETPHCQHERSKGGCNRLTADYRSVSSAHAHWPGEQSATEGLRSRDLHKRQQRRSQGALTWTSKVNKLSQWNNLHITCHVSLIIGGFLKTKEMISAPAVSAKDKLNRSQQSLQQSLANAVPAYYLNQPSNVPSPLSFPLHIPLLTSFLISKSLPLSTNCVHGNRKKHNMKYCMDAGYT